jgi:cytochrome c oxidase cbb3-type subunit 3
MSGFRRGPGLLLGAAALVVLLIGLIAVQAHAHALRSRFLVTDPDKFESQPDLVRYADGLARPAYAKHCASCHGANLKGDQAKGAPNLSDTVWLYNAGDVADVERTILYGIRSGNAKAHNITDMPALGRSLQLTPQEASDVTSYVLAFTRPQADPAAVQRGSQIFQGKGVCYDCHSGDAAGNPDYGAPNLADNDWLYGGSRDQVYSSVFNGRHGRCPAWIGKLSAEQIRALALYLHLKAEQAASLPGGTHGAKRG